MRRFNNAFLGLTLLLLGGLAVQAAEDSRTSAGGDVVVAELGKVFSLPYEQTAKLASESLEMRFTHVSEDSRCPPGMACVWAGQVEIQLEVTFSNGKSEELSLTTLDQQPEKLATAGGYTFRLAGIAPEQKGDTSDPSTYIAQIEVTRKP